jgi:hypothetical protein
VKALAALACLLTAAPALAQRTEIAALAGYTTPGVIDMKAEGVRELEVGGSFTGGIAVARFFSDHAGVEASWTQQHSALVLGTADGTADLFDMSLDLLQGSFVYQFGALDARLRPFVLASLGATFLSADDLEGEAKFSWALGLGLKWFPAAKVGGRVQARYAPTRLNDASSDSCDPFGFCQGTLSQFELMGGLVFRF